MSLPPELDIGRDDGLTRERWERTMGWIAAKIRALETVQPSWEAAVNELRQFGLVRLDNAIQPVYDRLVAIGQLGALFRATSSTSLAVGTGIKVLAVAEAEREAFAAAAFLGIQKVGDPTVAMWGALQSYNRETGLLTILVSQAIGDGSHADWEIFPTVAPDAAHAGRTDNPHSVTPAQIGAPTSAQMASAIADAVSDVRGGATTNYNTLKKLEDLLAPILAGADSAYDTFAEIYAYITSDVDAGVAMNAAIANRLRVDAAMGLTAGQQAQARANIAVREMLTGDRTYYVRPDGNDSNDGSADTSGAAFLTIQAAINAVRALDIGTRTVTIKLADGTYSSGILLSGPWVGSGVVQIVGNTTTPANVIVTGTSCFDIANGCRLTLSGFELQGTGGFGIGATARAGGILTIGASMRFGACTGFHLSAIERGIITATGDYAIVGGATRHWYCSSGGMIQISGRTITLTGTPAFSARFAETRDAGVVTCSGNTFSGAATGSRYQVATNGVITTGGGGSDYLPGNAAGSASSGGQYS